MSYFVFEYNRATADLKIAEFDDIAPALKDLGVKEANRATEVEVVLLLADSIEDLKRTHSRYFMGIDEMLDRMAADVRLSLSA